MASENSKKKILFNKENVDNFRSRLIQLEQTVNNTITQAINELKKSVSNGKQQLASAITAHNGKVSDADGDGVSTFSELQSGIDNLVSDTAAPGHVLTGVTFAANGVSHQSGTMPNNGAWVNVNPGNSLIYIPAGYHSGGGYVDARQSYNTGYNSGYTSGYNNGVSSGSGEDYIIETGSFSEAGTNGTHYYQIATNIANVTDVFLEGGSADHQLASMRRWYKLSDGRIEVVWQDNCAGGPIFDCKWLVYGVNPNKITLPVIGMHFEGWHTEGASYGAGGVSSFCGYILISSIMSASGYNRLTLDVGATSGDMYCRGLGFYSDSGYSNLIYTGSKGSAAKTFTYDEVKNIGALYYKVVNVSNNPGTAYSAYITLNIQYFHM